VAKRGIVPKVLVSTSVSLLANVYDGWLSARMRRWKKHTYFDAKAKNTSIGNVASIEFRAVSF
jgi:hypothetical protein